MLDLCDGLSDLDAAWAGIGAVEGGTAAPYAFFVVENLEAHVSTFIAIIEDETMGVDDGGGTEVLAVSPKHRA